RRGVTVHRPADHRRLYGASAGNQSRHIGSASFAARCFPLAVRMVLCDPGMTPQSAASTVCRARSEPTRGRRNAHSRAVVQDLTMSRIVDRLAIGVLAAVAIVALLPFPHYPLTSDISST